MEAQPIDLRGSRGLRRDEPVQPDAHRLAVVHRVVEVDVAGIRVDAPEVGVADSLFNVGVAAQRHLI